MSENDVVDYKVKRAAADNALHKIAHIVADEQQAETDKARAVRRLLRYGVLVISVIGVVVAWRRGVF